MICSPKTKPKLSNESKSKGGIFSYFKDLVTGSNAEEKAADMSIEDAIPFTDLKHMRKLCLEIYLHDDVNLICTGSIEKNTNLLALYSRIINVYRCLYSPLVMYEMEKWVGVQQMIWTCKPLQHVSKLTVAFYVKFKSFFPGI